MQPDLSLIYNSRNTDQDSVVGYGWWLSIPYIERLNKTGSQDLYGSNAYFTSSLDGELAVASGTAVTATASSTVNLLVVGGGGGGGGSSNGFTSGGGGGAGGYQTDASHTLAAGAYSVTVGAGGGGGAGSAGGNAGKGTNGGDSKFDTITATGGGGGAGDGNSTNSIGNNGGSGGGSAKLDNSAGGTGSQGGKWRSLRFQAPRARLTTSASASFLHRDIARMVESGVAAHAACKAART
jgi:hypothetical protein